jgi:hypothetical protein
MLNNNLIFNYIIPSLVNSTLWSAFLSVLWSLLLALIFLVTKPKDHKTILYAAIGCFFGIEIVCMIPMFSIPGVILGLSTGSGYAFLPVMFITVILAPIGAIVGSSIAVKIKFLRKHFVGKVILLLIVTYVFMAVCIYASFSLTCKIPNVDWYCKAVGF